MMKWKKVLIGAFLGLIGLSDFSVLMASHQADYIDTESRRMSGTSSLVGPAPVVVGQDETEELHHDGSVSERCAALMQISSVSEGMDKLRMNAESQEAPGSLLWDDVSTPEDSPDLFFNHLTAISGNPNLYGQILELAGHAEGAANLGILLADPLLRAALAHWPSETTDGMIGRAEEPSSPQDNAAAILMRLKRAGMLAAAASKAKSATDEICEALYREIYPTMSDFVYLAQTLTGFDRAHGRIRSSNPRNEVTQAVKDVIRKGLRELEYLKITKRMRTVIYAGEKAEAVSSQAQRAALNILEGAALTPEMDAFINKAHEAAEAIDRVAPLLPAIQVWGRKLRNTRVPEIARLHKAAQAAAVMVLTHAREEPEEPEFFNAAPTLLDSPLLK